MSELRWDPLKRHWVIIAADRGRRPNDFLTADPPTPMTSCPFCYGNEDKTPPEIFAIRPAGAPNTPGWQRLPTRCTTWGIRGRSLRRRLSPAAGLDDKRGRSLTCVRLPHPRADYLEGGVNRWLAANRSCVSGSS